MAYLTNPGDWLAGHLADLHTFMSINQTETVTTVWMKVLLKPCHIENEKLKESTFSHLREVDLKKFFQDFLV